MKEPGKLKTFLFSIGLTLGSLLLCFVVSETWLTFRYHKEIERIDARTGKRNLCSTVSEYPELIYTLIPLKCGANSHGFRDFEYPYEKESGVFRLVILGDSVAIGQGVKLVDSFGKLLEKKLNSPRDARIQKVEVIVLAQSGYSSSQELFLLQHEAFKYAPDLVLWTYVLNDPAHPVYHNANGELGLYYYKPRFHTANFVARKLFEIKERIRGEACNKEYYAFLHCAYWDEVVTTFGNIAALAKQHRVPILVAIFPIFEDNLDEYSLAPLHARLTEAAQTAGLPVIDLLAAYRSQDPAALTQTLPQGGRDLLHPNEAGHRIAADFLYESLMASGRIAPAEP